MKQYVYVESINYTCVPLIHPSLTEENKAWLQIQFQELLQSFLGRHAALIV